MNNPQLHKEFETITRLIHEARQRSFTKANAELVLLYFRVGKVVSEKVEAGIWGNKTVDELASFIQTQVYDIKGFNRRGLYRMKQFYETYQPTSDCYALWIEGKHEEQYKASAKTSDPGVEKIVSPAMAQLQITDNQYIKFVSSLLTQISWSHHLTILSKTRKPEEKLFYIITTINEMLSVRELQRQLNSSQFERTILKEQKTGQVSKPEYLPENIFKDPYVFEFLNLPEIHSESDLEQALIQNLRNFILEIGKGFTYMGSQYRIQAGNKDYYTDLLFYNRDLQCLVMFELKIEDFAPEHLGKLNFYLEALDQNIKRPFENPTIGVLLCKGKDKEVVEYSMARNTSPTVIAEYETKLIDKKTLENKLHELAETFENKD